MIHTSPGYLCITSQHGCKKCGKSDIHGLVSFPYMTGQHARQSRDLGANERWKKISSVNTTLSFKNSNSVGSDSMMSWLLIVLTWH